MIVASIESKKMAKALYCLQGKKPPASTIRSIYGRRRITGCFPSLGIPCKCTKVYTALSKKKRSC